MTFVYFATSAVTRILFVAERDAMLHQGYGNWNKRDYNAFIKASEKYGRGDVKMISTEIDGKTYEDVLSYHQVKHAIFYLFYCSKITF